MSKLNNISYMVYIMITPVVSIIFGILNVLSIVIFVRRFRLMSFSLLVIVNICVCDIMICLVSNNFYLANILHPLYKWSTGPIACKFFKTFTMTINISQTFCFMLLCLDRTRRILMPSKIQWSRTHGVFALALTWSVSLLLTAERMILFDEIQTYESDNSTNTSRVVDFTCAPMKTGSTVYVVFTIVQFIGGYLIPIISIVTLLLICEISLQRLQCQGQMTTSSSVMNQQLSRVFGLTAIMFLLIWSPFYVLSILDLEMVLRGRPELTDMNLSLRCTLLVAGSGKPLIYIATLQRYRQAMKCYSRNQQT